MGARGPLGKDERTRKRDNVTRDQLKITGEIHGYDLPTDFAPEGGWHSAVVRWWDAFRSSPMAARVETDVQWETLAAAMLLYQEYLTIGARGRVMRMSEFRAFFANYFITPGDLRRNGLEIVEPEAASDKTDTPDSGTVSNSFVERRQRILMNGDQPTSKKGPAKKKTAVKKPAVKKAAAKQPVAKKKTAAKKAVAKKPPAKK